MVNQIVISEKVFQVIKEKENLVRDIVEKKKTVVVFGLKEEHIPVLSEREKKEKHCVEELTDTVQEDTEVSGEVEEICRLGKYTEGGHCPVKIRFRSQTAAEEILTKIWKLSKTMKYKQVWVKKDMKKEERATENELRREVKEKK